jgi:uncharacterized DUF497 family protein
METDIVCKPSAFKHGVSETDIRKAFEQRLFDHAMSGEEHKNLLIGLDRNGNLLEIIYNILDSDIINVFHAMKCRKAYQAFLNLWERKE